MTNRYEGAKAADVASTLHDYLDSADLGEGYVCFGRDRLGENPDTERGAVWVNIIGTAADLPPTFTDALPFALPEHADVLLAEPIDEPTVTIFGFRYRRGVETLYSVLGMVPDEATGPWALYVPSMGGADVRALFDSVDVEGSSRE